MKKISLVTLLVTLSIQLSLLGCARASSPEILVFAKTQGFYHTSIPKGMATILQICSENGIAVDTSRDAEIFTFENLKKYKAVIFLNTSGDILNEAQQAAFEKYMQSGGGFVGVHAASDTEYDWPWYNKLVGAYFLSHPAQQQAVIQVADRSHPSVSFLPEQWIRTDEWYNFKNISPDIKVLAYLDETSYQGGENGERHPFIWYHEFDGGRAFYTGVGHRDDNYDEPLLQKHLLGAIRWAGNIR